MDGCALGQSTNQEMVMPVFNSDTDFVASLDKAQREYYLGRMAEWQHQLQDALQAMSRSLSVVSTWNSDTLSLLSSFSSKPRRVLIVKGVEYRYSTLPGSGRIKVSFGNGLPIAMWESGVKDPWVLPLGGFGAFQQSGHAQALHRLLLDVDRRRRM